MTASNGEGQSTLNCPWLSACCVGRVGNSSLRFSDVAHDPSNPAADQAPDSIMEGSVNATDDERRDGEIHAVAKRRRIGGEVEEGGDRGRGRGGCREAGGRCREQCGGRFGQWESRRGNGWSNSRGRPSDRRFGRRGVAHPDVTDDGLDRRVRTDVVYTQPNHVVAVGDVRRVPYGE